jgi:hypothetical protein
MEFRFMSTVGLGEIAMTVYRLRWLSYVEIAYASTVSVIRVYGDAIRAGLKFYVPSERHQEK